MGPVSSSQPGLSPSPHLQQNQEVPPSHMRIKDPENETKLFPLCSNMAEASISVAQDQLSCSICLDLLKDPVTIPCGHSYCMDCIKGCWKQEDYVGIYRCPQCRQTFTSKPVLGRNTMLAQVVEKLKTGLQAVRCYAGPGDVECDVCTGRKLKAVKSCLVCLASYCETHLQPHYVSPTFKKHKLTEATENLLDKICPRHDKLLEFYCRSDQQCICSACLVDEHRGHDTVSAAEGRTEKQEQVEEAQREFQQRIQQREKEVQELRQAVDSLTCSAQAAVEDTDCIVAEMICFIRKMHLELKDLIRAQKKAALSQVKQHLEKLEQEVAELRRTDAELEQLSHTEDHIHFLQSFQAACAPPASGELPVIPVRRHCSFGDVGVLVSEMKQHLEGFCRNELIKTSHQLKEVHIFGPRTSKDFLQYMSEVTADIGTMNCKLSLSEGNKVVMRTEDPQPYPDHPERFEHWAQMLCKEPQSGCCYWEMEWSGRGVDIAMAYKGIRRKDRGDESRFGSNDASWSLTCSHSGCYFRHSKVETIISGPSSSTVGVYLDHRAGTLSFYSVSDTVTLLHRVQTTFTEPLYPGFCVWPHTSVKICTEP